MKELAKLKSNLRLDTPKEAIIAPPDPPLNADGEIRYDDFGRAVRDSQEWRARSELAEKVWHLKVEAKALTSETYSYRSMVREDYVQNIEATIRKIEAALEKR